MRALRTRLWRWTEWCLMLLFDRPTSEMRREAEEFERQFPGAGKYTGRTYI